MRDRKDSHLHAHDKKHEASAPFGHDREAKPASPVTPSSRTEQEARDVEEKRRHSSSENALDSTQDKNPVPPGSTRK